MARGDGTLQLWETATAVCGAIIGINPFDQPDVESAKAASRGLLEGGRVRLLSITLDPARDTPDVLRRYMKLYDADPSSWTFLTGSRQRDRCPEPRL